MNKLAPQPPHEIELYDQAFVDHYYKDDQEAALEVVSGNEQPANLTQTAKRIAEIIRTENLNREAAVLKGESNFYRNKIEQLQSESQLDARTGFLTKKAFIEASKDFFVEAKTINNRDNKYARAEDESKKSLAIIAMDLDNLREFNKYGHFVGDSAIEKFAAKLSSQLRDGDIAGRGSKESDEFLIAAQGLDEDSLVSMVSRLICSVHGTQVEYQGGPVPVDMTMSIGAALFTEADFETVEEMLALADARQIEAKKTGKDRAVLSGAGMIR